MSNATTRHINVDKERDIPVIYQIPVTVLNGMKFYPTKGIVDTGADYCGVTENIITRLELPKVLGERVKVRNAAGEDVVLDVYKAGFCIDTLDGKTGIKVIKCNKGNDGSEVIIGKSFLKYYDLSITNSENEVVISLRIPTGDTIDFKETAD